MKNDVAAGIYVIRKLIERIDRVGDDILSTG